MNEKIKGLDSLESLLKVVSGEAAVWGFKSGVAQSRVMEYEFRKKVAAKNEKQFQNSLLGYAIIAALTIVTIVVFALTDVVGGVYIGCGLLGWCIAMLVNSAVYRSHFHKEQMLYDKFTKDWTDMQSRDKLASTTEELMEFSSQAVQVARITVDDNASPEEPQDEPTEDPEFDEALKNLLEEHDDNA